MPLGMPPELDEPQIKLRKDAEEPPYSSFADWREKTGAQDRDARTFSENVAKAKAAEEKARLLSRQQMAEQAISAYAAAGIHLSTDAMEKIRADALK